MSNFNVIADHYGSRTADIYDRATASFWGYTATLEAIAYELVYGRNLIANKNRPLRILDLGTGTGNLIAGISKLLPMDGLRWTAVDKSCDMPMKAMKKLACIGIKAEIHITPMQKLTLSSEMFDAVVSSFAIHHLNGIEKAQLFKKVRSLTKPGGVFVFGDRFSELSEDHLRVAAAHFRQFGPNHIRTKKLPEVIAYMREQFILDGDKPSTKQEQMAWMKSAGWRDVQNPYRSFICGVISGIK